jgi:hypothetical protein
MEISVPRKKTAVDKSPKYDYVNDGTGKFFSLTNDNFLSELGYQVVIWISLF